MMRYSMRSVEAASFYFEHSVPSRPYTNTHLYTNKTHSPMFDRMNLDHYGSEKKFPIQECVCNNRDNIIK